MTGRSIRISAFTPEGDMAAKNAQFKNQSKSSHATDDADLARPQRTVLAQAISTALIAGVASGPLLAQEPALEEIIVTATKRAESIMDVPLAITAISGEAIREINLNDIKDLIHLTPGIAGNSKDSFLDFINVRGIRTIDYGNGGDPSVALFKNGMYQGRTGSGVSSLYDIERSEVLRGPQGFLFARNSVSGAFNIITAKPDLNATGGYAELDVGERGVFVFEGAVNVPMSDTFGIRLAGYHSEEDGWVPNLAGGPDLIDHKKDAFRLTGRYQTDRLTTDLMLEYEERDQFGTVYRATGLGRAFKVHDTRVNGGVLIETSPDGRTVNNDNSLQPRDDAEIFSSQLLIDYETDWGTFSSLTAFKDYEYQYVEDFDALPLILFNYGQDQEGDYIEQEFRLTSGSDGPLSWYAGASFYQENVDTVFLGEADEDHYCLGYWYYTCQNLFDYYNYWDYTGMTTYYGDTLDYYFGTTTWTPSTSGLVRDRNRVIGDYRGYSAYVDLSYQFNDAFDVSVGLRYSYDEKEFSQEVLPDPGNSLLRYKMQSGFSTPNGPLVDKKDWDEVTWRVVANWRPDDNNLFFVSAASGYKPGGFGSFNFEPKPGQPGCTLPFGLCVADPATARPGDFGPETVISYEIGYKGTILGGRSQLAVNAFFYDYEDMQAIFTERKTVIVDNIGQVDGTGVEAELNTVFNDNLSLQLGASWLDTEAHDVRNFCDNGKEILGFGGRQVCEGQSIPWAPEYTAFAVLRANFEAGQGEVFGTLTWSWEDDFRGDWPPPEVVYQRVEALNQTDIVVGYRNDAWRISAYVENVFDGVWYDGNYADSKAPFYIYPQHTFGPARPRTAGVRFGIEF
jgi:iron complex outermembrane receptor protein